MTSLRRRRLDDMQLRNLSPETQTTYIQQVARFARHFRQSPADLRIARVAGFAITIIS
jgi:integrase/recombinase XerD